MEERAVVMMLIMTWRRTIDSDSMIYELPTYFVSIDSTLFCILEWNFLNIYVIHFYFNDLMKNILFVILFYSSKF